MRYYGAYTFHSTKKKRKEMKQNYLIGKPVDHIYYFLVKQQMFGLLHLKVHIILFGPFKLSFSNESFYKLSLVCKNCRAPNFWKSTMSFCELQNSLAYIQ